MRYKDNEKLIRNGLWTKTSSTTATILKTTCWQSRTYTFVDVAITALLHVRRLLWSCKSSKAVAFRGAFGQLPTCINKPTNKIKEMNKRMNKPNTQQHTNEIKLHSMPKQHLQHMQHNTIFLKLLEGHNKRKGTKLILYFNRGVQIKSNTTTPVTFIKPYSKRYKQNAQMKFERKPRK